MFPSSLPSWKSNGNGARKRDRGKESSMSNNKPAGTCYAKRGGSETIQEKEDMTGLLCFPYLLLHFTVDGTHSQTHARCDPFMCSNFGTSAEQLWNKLIGWNVQVPSLSLYSPKDNLRREKCIQLGTRRLEHGTYRLVRSFVPWHL